MRPLSYSANATLQSCAQLYDFKYNSQLESFDVSVPAYAGSAMAEALHWLHTEGKEIWILDQVKAHEGAVAALEAAWGEFVTPPGKHSYLTLGHLETVLHYYTLERDPKQVLALSDGHKVLSEVKTTFDWPMLRNGELDMISVTGIPDLPAKVAGQRAVIDWKCTTMYVNDWWAKKFSVIGHQLRTYMEMLRHQYGIETDVAYVDGIHIGKKAAEGPKAWKGLKSVRSRLFGPFNFTESQRRETWEWYKVGEKQREFFAAEGIWPQNEGACSDYGGCDFQKLCGMSPVVRKARSQQMFRKGER